MTVAERAEDVWTAVFFGALAGAAAVALLYFIVGIALPLKHHVVYQGNLVEVDCGTYLEPSAPFGEEPECEKVAREAKAGMQKVAVVAGAVIMLVVAVAVACNTPASRPRPPAASGPTTR